ncbi:MAG: hypothetical protein V3575_05145 [Candidatus Absconditabacteria bacterium]
MNIKDDSMYIEIRVKDEPGIGDRIQNLLRIKGFFIEKYEYFQIGDGELKFRFVFNKDKSILKDTNQAAFLISGFRDVIDCVNIEGLV